MNLSEEEFNANPLSPKEFADEIQAAYIAATESQKNLTLKQEYTVPGAKVWKDFVKESYLTVENPDTVTWDAYLDAKSLVASKKFLYSVKDFGHIDDNGNGEIDMKEAMKHMGQKKVEHLMKKDKNFDELISLAEYMKTVVNPFTIVVEEYKYRYNNFMEYHEIRH